MEYVYSAMLLHSAGQPVNEENVKKVIQASGAKVNDAKVKALVAALEGVNIDEVVSKAAMPVAAVAAVPAASGEAPKEAKKEENPEDQKKKAEEAAVGLASLFG